MRRIVGVIMFSLMSVVCHAAGALKYDFVVDANGIGDFTSVQAAVNAVPDFRKAGPTKIFIKKGVYKEKIVIAETKQGVQFYGEEGTVITYDDHANKPNVFGENKGTSGSSTIYVFGPDFVAENITFENSSGPVGQAVFRLGVIGRFSANAASWGSKIRSILMVRIPGSISRIVISRGRWTSFSGRRRLFSCAATFTASQKDMSPLLLLRRGCPMDMCSTTAT